MNDDPARGVLRVGTWNIHELVPEAGPQDATGIERQLIDQVNAAALDVLLLQEVPFGPDGGSAALDLLTARTDLRHASGAPISPSVFAHDQRSGLAVLSRLPQPVSSSMLFPNPHLSVAAADGARKTSWDKGIQLAGIEAFGVPLTVASLHSQPFHVFGRDAADKEFERIWQAMASLFDGLRTPWIIVGGDFNIEDRDLLFRHLERRRLRGANPGIITHKGRAVDDIVHDEALEVRNFSVFPGFSDHACCVAEAVLRREAAP